MANLLQAICKERALQLDLRVAKVEKATHELLDLLLPEEDRILDMSERNTPVNSQSRASILHAPEEVELRPGERSQQREKQRKHELQQEAQAILDHFAHKTLEGLIRCTRSALEGIRRRVNTPTALLYGEGAVDKRRGHRPVFKVKLALSIPTIIMKPSLEEVQGFLNCAVQHITAVHKSVHQWGQVRDVPQILELAAGSYAALQSVSVAKTSQAQVGITLRLPLKDFFKAVSEHKEIAKLVSMLSTSVSSTKSLVLEALEHFKQYQELWTVDREKHMNLFLESNPTLSDFEAQMRDYEKLGVTLTEEVTSLPAGALALEAEDLKIALEAEAKAWKVLYGRSMNSKYQTLMDQIMEQLDDLSKRMSRPIKDLDDVRQAMTSLKELREKEIFIDSTLGPVEVSWVVYLVDQ